MDSDFVPMDVEEAINNECVEDQGKMPACELQQTLQEVGNAGTTLENCQAVAVDNSFSPTNTLNTAYNHQHFCKSTWQILQIQKPHNPLRKYKHSCLN